MVVEKTPEPKITEAVWPIITLGSGGSAEIRDSISYQGEDGRMWVRFFLKPFNEFKHIYRHQIHEKDWKMGAFIYWDCPEEYVVVLNDSPTCKRHQSLVNYDLSPGPLYGLDKINFDRIIQIMKNVKAKEKTIARLNREIKQMAERDWIQMIQQTIDESTEKVWRKYLQK